MLIGGNLFHVFSVKSDDSDADSDYFVVINSQTEDAARDNHLFAITSKRTSPVEYAAEATEEVAASTFVVPSSDLGIKSSASSSANVAMVSPPKEEDNGVVGTFTFFLTSSVIFNTWRRT